MEDQISLLKGAALEMYHIALNPTFCPKSHHFLCGPLRYSMKDAAHGERDGKGTGVFNTHARAHPGAPGIECKCT